MYLRVDIFPFKEAVYPKPNQFCIFTDVGQIKQLKRFLNLVYTVSTKILLKF